MGLRVLVIQAVCLLPEGSAGPVSIPLWMESLQKRWQRAYLRYSLTKAGETKKFYVASGKGTIFPTIEGLQQNSRAILGGSVDLVSRVLSKLTLIGCYQYA